MHIEVGQGKSRILGCLWGKQEGAVDVTVLMPCLNEVGSLRHCIANAQQALAKLAQQYGLTGEILIADNGSADGSQALARSLGARVEPIAQRGYGATLIGGCHVARGQFILIGDSDGSYDFLDGVPMVAQLAEGADVCIGSRFKGCIMPGAMPWKNRRIGNPLLTGILNLLFGAGISDAHCGLRAIRKEAFLTLGLASTGMEFASEMVIKATLHRMVITEVPAKLLPDLRDRAPHLRPWRDGWRHLRYLFMLSPFWLFGVPAAVGTITASLILGAALIEDFAPGSFPVIGAYWTILGGALLSFAHLSAMAALASLLYGIRSGFRAPMRLLEPLAAHVSLESMLVAGGTTAAAGLAILGGVLWGWSARGFGPASSVVPAVLGTALLTIGFQNALWGFLMSVIAGNEAAFARRMIVPTPIGSTSRIPA